MRLETQLLVQRTRGAVTFVDIQNDQAKAVRMQSRYDGGRYSPGVAPSATERRH